MSIKHSENYKLEIERRKNRTKNIGEEIITNNNYAIIEISLILACSDVLFSHMDHTIHILVSKDHKRNMLGKKLLLIINV